MTYTLANSRGQITYTVTIVTGASTPIMMWYPSGP